jgi:methylisocitrate lyase
MVKKIRAAVDARRDSNFLIMARTDAKSSEGIEAAIDRAKAYIDAGADAIFPEALNTIEEFEIFRKAIDVPLLANMTEFGKSPLLGFSQLENLGYNLVIYPVSTLRSAMGASDRLLSEIRIGGTQAPLVQSMQTRAELYDLLQYPDYNQFDQSIFNFQVSHAAEPESPQKNAGKEQ